MHSEINYVAQIREILILSIKIADLHGVKNHFAGQ